MIPYLLVFWFLLPVSQAGDPPVSETMIIEMSSKEQCERAQRELNKREDCVAVCHKVRS